MWGIKAEGEATAGVVIASANQIHDCGRANEPGSGRVPSLIRDPCLHGLMELQISTAIFNLRLVQAKCIFFFERPVLAKLPRGS